MEEDKNHIPTATTINPTREEIERGVSNELQGCYESRVENGHARTCSCYDTSVRCHSRQGVIAWFGSEHSAYQRATLPLRSKQTIRDKVLPV